MSLIMKEDIKRWFVEEVVDMLMAMIPAAKAGGFEVPLLEVLTTKATSIIRAHFSWVPDTLGRIEDKLDILVPMKYICDVESGNISAASWLWKYTPEEEGETEFIDVIPGKQVVVIPLMPDQLKDHTFYSRGQVFVSKNP